MNQPDNPSVQIDGKEYNFKDLPEPVQNLVALHNKWSNDLLIAKTEVMKLEFALQKAATEIGNEMQKNSKPASPAHTIVTPPRPPLETFPEYDTLRSSGDMVS